jgi:hypothetical protein
LFVVKLDSGMYNRADLHSAVAIPPSILTGTTYLNFSLLNSCMKYNETQGIEGNTMSLAENVMRH